MAGRKVSIPETFRNGPGLRVLNRTECWYGPGYCGICGTRGDELIPRAVRYWDPYDGWRTGVLCSYCADECRVRGPQADDYAVVTQAQHADPLIIDTLASLGDLDAMHTETDDMRGSS